MGTWICRMLLWILVFFVGTSIFSVLNMIVYGLASGRKCGHSNASLRVRDTLVKVAGGIAALACMCVFASYTKAIIVFLFFCVLTVVTLLDIDTMEIDDGCWMAILVLSVAAVFAMPDITIAQRLLGLVCVSVPLLLIAVAIPGAFGGGDIKLMAACGLFLGWRLTLISTALAIIAGGGYGVYLLATGKKERKEHFAFGPFLCAGMVLGIFFEQQIVDWYLGVGIF